MKPNITLHFNALNSQTLDHSKRNASEVSMPFGETTLIAIAEGVVIHQTFSSYLCFIDILEYSLDRPLKLNYSMANTANMLLINFNSISKCRDESKTLLFEVEEPSCCMLLQQQGDYIADYEAGSHKIILLTIRQDWLSSKTTNFPLFTPLISPTQAVSTPLAQLPKCPLTTEIQAPINFIKNPKNHSENRQENAIYASLFDLLSGYHNLLTKKQYSKSVVHKQIKAAFQKLLDENFSTELVDDKSFFTNQLRISETELNKFCKEVLKTPLHRYVIDYRLLRAFKLVIFSDKKINVIAKEVGYSDPHFFSRAFKKKHNITPEELRNFWKGSRKPLSS
ncbi:AraC family transcriptional regulator [Pedobacter sp. MC2016-14]|uniref:helix-turn-helix domain-containing protein n=1 Tax=Pedobacter sp. MC2016-14 TaxID=2897327 RepID=UPI001E5F5DED|nr:AraC family transcriptional regulator [Pedobacter sp. MC2016-14]MCD0488326.1 AraC family transcriptional regulator [Pedobacter sp. MC2016-14]